MRAFSKNTQNNNKPTTPVSQGKYAENTHFININKIQIVATTYFISLYSVLYLGISAIRAESRQGGVLFCLPSPNLAVCFGPDPLAGAWALLQRLPVTCRISPECSHPLLPSGSGQREPKGGSLHSSVWGGREETGESSSDFCSTFECTESGPRPTIYFFKGLLACR